MAAKNTDVTTRAETAVQEQSISQQAMANVAPPSGVLALDAFANGSIILDGLEISVGKSITRPVMKQVDNAICVFRIDGPFREGEDLNEKAKRSAARKKTEAKKVTDMAPARLVDVYNYLTKTDEVCIANTVFEESILEVFPGTNDNGVPEYVGKSFAMSSIKRADKRYRDYSIRVITVNSVTGAAKEENKIIDHA